MIDFIGAKIGKDYNNNNGCHFNVWAPNANNIYVTGNFNNWERNIKELKDKGYQLENLDNGYHAGFIKGVKNGDGYKYILDTKNNKIIERIDPAARDTDHSGAHDPNNHGYVIDPAYEWDYFKTPDFRDINLYQLHVGSFAGFNDGITVNNNTAKISQIECKLEYIKEMGFTAIELLPVQEFRGDVGKGYAPAFYFALESAYGTPEEYRHFVNEAHKKGLAVIFDVVYNHANDDENDGSLTNFDGDNTNNGIYFSEYTYCGGRVPAFWKQEVKDFFLENAKMYFREYNADGLRFDLTNEIQNNSNYEDGKKFLQYMTWHLKSEHPDKYLIAEHHPEGDDIIRNVGFHATWAANSHHEFQRAMYGEDPVNKIKNIIGKNYGYGRNYPDQWNLIKYTLGSHDECNDGDGGTTVNKENVNDKHRYFIEFFGGRADALARAKTRMGWALNVAMMGTPMLFMGNECHMYGYWNDDSDCNGDHRFDWSVAGDPVGMTMRKMVSNVNSIRLSNPAFRSEEIYYGFHDDFDNNVFAFKRCHYNENVILVILNMSDIDFEDHSYGVSIGEHEGKWEQIFCSQDALYGGRDEAGNAFYEPLTDNGKIYINLPQWSVVMMKLAH
ncbi:MAG TPA: alpha-amylase family glycosyl hydrolase [Candidatus Wallbacteria bacterium]|nr:alpha-amylase family glycosyl hydrolase [Candidatus Wallbacteria bacterium]